MQRTRFGDMACSIARTLDVIGEPWSPLILRDVFVGIDRFEQIQPDLGISRKVLAERLVARRARRPRAPAVRAGLHGHEYTLTTKGRELCDLLLVMVRWGDRWTAGEAGPPVLYRHHACGEISHVELHCSRCDRPMHATDIDVLPGPEPPSSPSPFNGPAITPLPRRGTAATG